MKLFENAAENLAKDYQTFLDYIEANDVRLSKTTEHLGKKDCWALNQSFLTIREPYPNAGRTQDFYVVIDFFLCFSEYAGILNLVKKKGSGIGLVRSERYMDFNKLTSMEKYALMMAVWFGIYQKTVNDASLSFLVQNLLESMSGSAPGEPLKARGHSDRSFWGIYYSMSLRLFALFHMVEIQWLDGTVEDKENKFRIKALYQTEEGAAVIKLYEDLERVFWTAETFEEALEKIVRIMGLPADAVEKLNALMNRTVDAGNCTVELKVEVGACVRTIRMGDQYTLDDLHYLIQKSVDFDMDHLYYFQLGAGNNKCLYYGPNCDDEPLASETQLAQLGLYEGMNFIYLFDFGDCWKFSITVMHLLPEHMEICEITNTKGESPQQYPDW